MADEVKFSVSSATVPIPLVKSQTGLFLENADQVEFEMYKNTKGLRKNRYTLVAERDKKTYVGRNYGKDAPDSSRKVKYCVAVRKKNKVKILPATMFQLKPDFLVDGIELEDDSESEEDVKKENKKDITDDLVASFGTRRKRKSLGVRDRNDLTSGAVQAAMTPLLNKVKMQPETLQFEHEDDQGPSLLPPCNKDAEHVKDVYSWQHIISSEELDMLSDLAEPLLESTAESLQEMQENQTYPRYILSHFPDILQNHASVSKKLVCFLVYINALMKIYNMDNRTISKKDSLSELPDEIKSKLLEEFTVKQRGSARSVPPKLKEKILVYILVLALTLEDFTIKTDLFQQDLNLTSQKMQGILSILGCRIKTLKVPGKAHCLQATLKLPLNLPEKSPLKRRRSYRR